MATVVMNQLKKHIADGTIDLLTSTIKLGLATSTYVPNADDTFADDGSADDFSSGELSGVSGYTGGFGGSGRLTLGSKSVAQDDTNDRAEFTCANPAYGALGAGGTIAYAVLLIETTNDAASRVYAAFDITDTPTNGSTITLTINAEGLIQFA